MISLPNNKVIEIKIDITKNNIWVNICKVKNTNYFLRVVCLPIYNIDLLETIITKF